MRCYVVMLQDEYCVKLNVNYTYTKKKKDVQSKEEVKTNGHICTQR